MPVKRGIIWAIPPSRMAFAASGLRGLEMLPLGRRLILELLLEEMASTGISEGLLLSNTDVPEPLLQIYHQGESDMVLPLQDLAGARRIQLQQRALPGGTSIAEGILAVEDFLQGEPFLVMEADVVWATLPGHQTISARLSDTLDGAGADVAVVAEHVKRTELSMHTVLRSISGMESKPSFLVRDIIQRPAPGEPVSNFALAGRYACCSVLIDYLKDMPASDRLDLVSTLRRLAHDRDAVWATRSRQGEHCFHLTNLLQYSRAFLNYALEDPEVGLAVRDYMEELVGVRWA